MALYCCSLESHPCDFKDNSFSLEPSIWAVFLFVNGNRS